MHICLTVAWLFTSIYGGILIFRALRPTLNRIQLRTSLQPEMLVVCVRQERLLLLAGAAATILWAAILAATTWAFITDAPATCQLYLC